MGVKLAKLLNDSKTAISFPKLARKVIAIDGLNALYQFITVIRQRDGTHLKDSMGNVTSHLVGLLYRNINFLENDIKAVYVFDGKSPDLKLDEIKKRKARKMEAENNLKDAIQKGDKDSVIKYSKQTSTVSTKMIEESKKLIEYMGIPSIQAPGEGEAQAAYMSINGDVFACASQDYDSVLFGSEKLLLNFSSPRKNIALQIVVLQEMLESLGIVREQLVDIAILIGNDFCSGIKGIGQITALDLVKEYGDINNMMDKGVKARGIRIDLDLDLVNVVRDIFLNPLIEKEYPKLKWGRPQFSKIREFMVEEHDFQPSKIDKALYKLRRQGSANQTSIDKYF